MYILFFLFSEILYVFLMEKTNSIVFAFSKISAVQFLSKNQKLFVFIVVLGVV